MFLDKTNEELTVLAQNGDDMAFKVLIDKNERFIRHIVAKYSKPYQKEYKDIHSSARIGFIKSVYSFKIEKGFKLTTYAGLLMTQEIAQFYRTYNKIWRNEECVMNEIVVEATQGGSDMTFEDTIPSNEPELEQQLIDKELISTINDCVMSLEPTEQEIVKLYYYNGMRQLDIAKELGLWQQKISSMLKVINKKLKVRFIEEGLGEYNDVKGFVRNSKKV